MINQIIKASKIDFEKINRHISFISSMLDFAKKHNWRLVIYGGYGLDGYLQTITRNHGDIDLVMYGQTTRPEALTTIVGYLNTVVSDVEITSKEEDFLIDIKVKNQNIQGNFYYVQTAHDPYVNLNTIIKVDGTPVTNKEADFPPPVNGLLGKLKVEVQDQRAHLQDILRKRSTDDVLSRHDQDIENILNSAT